VYPIGFTDESWARTATAWPQLGSAAAAASGCRWRGWENVKVGEPEPDPDELTSERRPGCSATVAGSGAYAATERASPNFHKCTSPEADPVIIIQAHALKLNLSRTIGTCILTCTTLPLAFSATRAAPCLLPATMWPEQPQDNKKELAVRQNT
jgi:hypothetical protein